MKLYDMVNYSARSFVHRQSRSVLTILGIVIGIAAVVALLTIGLGFNASVEKELSGFGYNVIYVVPLAPGTGFGGGGMLPPSAGKLTEDDIDRVEKIPEVEEVSRSIERRGSVRFKDKEITSLISGIEPGIYEKMTSITVEEGRFLVDSDRHVAVIGRKVSGETFGQNNIVRTNSVLLINGVKYRVVGILAPSTSAFGGEIDSGIFVPTEDARELFAESLIDGEVDSVALSLTEGANIPDVIERMHLELDALRKVTEDDRDYSIISLETIQASIGEVLGLVTLFLGAVAAISLFVGGLAIATSMFTSVIERTHEIGVLKAVGANEDDILRIFLFESAAVGTLGGIAGTVLGLLIVFIGSLFGLPASFELSIALFGVLFASGIGILSGYIPARMAAKLSPVEALRYE